MCAIAFDPAWPLKLSKPKRQRGQKHSDASARTIMPAIKISGQLLVKNRQMQHAGRCTDRLLHSWNVYYRYTEND
jgi:hypothetical protein